MKITRVSCYQPPHPNPSLNQSTMVVLVETDEGISGVGEGGSPDTLVQCAGMLIGADPLRIQHLWQLMYRGMFYPAGREKLHALGALDLALWDIKGKALGVPVYELIGGLTHEHVECYSTAFPSHGTLAETAQACLEAGFRSFRTTVADPTDRTFDARRMVDETYRQCRAIRTALGPDRDWNIDVHTRLDMPDAVRLCRMLEELNPLFVEDPLRSENPGALAMLRSQTSVPLAVGEQFGARWDCHELVQRHTIDHLRVTLPNVGGITELIKIAALCETHYVGLVPHFTGPVALAALAHVLSALPIPALCEILGAAPQLPPYLSRGCRFSVGKLWPDQEPGLGVLFAPEAAQLVATVTEYAAPLPLFQRPDGSFTNW